MCGVQCPGILLEDPEKVGDGGEAAMTTEPPLRVGSREELVYLLGEACEIEYGLLCEYLFAQSSPAVRLSENCAYRYSHIRPCSISQASPSR